MRDLLYRLQAQSFSSHLGKKGNYSSRILYRVSRILILFSVGLLVFLLISCGKKEIKSLSEDSKIAQEAFNILDKLKKAYLERDHETLHEYTSKDYFTEIVGAIKNFDDAELSFTPTWVEIEDPTVYITVSWKGSWKLKGNVVDQRGIAIFEFKGRPLKLSGIHRDNPFGQPE